MSRKKQNAKASRRAVGRATHPIASRLRLLHHAHTGRLVRRQHTSYAVLLILLVITGFFVFIGYDITAADTQVGNMTVGLKVPGPPPAVGAVITSPKNGDTFKDAIVDVHGTCARNTEVIVYSNDTLVGTTLCSTSLTFQLKVQLFGGANSLTALNYDTLNQAGPITPTVKVKYTVPAVSPSSPVPVLPIVVPGVTPTPPQTCAQAPASNACHVTYATNTCDNYIGGNSLPESADVRVALVCLLRYADASGNATVGILLWGGKPPYALTIDWGDNSADTLKSVATPGYFTVTKHFAAKGIYTVTLHVSDSDGKQAYAQAAIEVPGPTPPANFVQYVGQSLNTSWFNSPVPTYLLAVAVVLGFWAGDYFERTILLSRKLRGGRHRHA
ncbi:MAG TPA: hypothetical protein VMT96_01090 [Candidatus Bathyarchaeia archaeon]|nr:hypothetical protein [Candidatus Bathyarchaeia archaeon]